jgi:hypothetical protein
VIVVDEREGSVGVGMQQRRVVPVRPRRGSGALTGDDRTASQISRGSPFFGDDVPVAALQRVKREVDLVDGEIGEAAGPEDDDLVIAGQQTDVLGVGHDGELQLPTDVDSAGLVGRVPARRHSVSIALPSFSGVVGVVAAQHVSSSSSYW